MKRLMFVLAGLLTAALLLPAGPSTAETAASEGDPPGPSLPDGMWVAGDFHVHTTYSHDAYGGPDDTNTEVDEAYTLGHSVENQFAIAAARGLDFLAITDHNDIRSQNDPGFGAHGVLGVPGYENSLRGHAQMIGATELYDNGDKTTAAVQAIADALRVDGGLFQINHPADGQLHAPDDWGYGLDIVPDTFEVWNITPLWQPPFPSASSIDVAIEFWEEFLALGHQIPVTGGSDNHWVSTTAVQGVGQPTTWVFVEGVNATSDLTVEHVLDGLREGRTTIAHQPPNHGMLRLELEANRNPHQDEHFDTMVGGNVPPAATFRVNVEPAPVGVVRIFTNEGLLFEQPAVTLDEFEVPKGTKWVRAELVAPDGAHIRTETCDPVVGDETTYCRDRIGLAAITSAIFVGAEEAENSTG